MLNFHHKKTTNFDWALKLQDLACEQFNKMQEEKAQNL